MRGGLDVEQMLEFGFLLRVEEPLIGPGRPVLGHADRIVGMEAIGGGRRRVDEPRHADPRRGPEGVEGAVDIDGSGDLGRGRPGDQEGQMHHDVGTFEHFREGVDVADVALVVGHLRPAVIGRIEATSGDAAHPRDPPVSLKQRDESEPKSAGRPCHRDGQALGPRRHASTLPIDEHHDRRGCCI